MSESEFIIVGLGGAGGKVVNAVAQDSEGHIKAVAVDTDFSAVSRLSYCQQVRIGATRFDGAGSGGDKSGAGMAADETPSLADCFENVKVAVIVAGIGKGTGSGVLPKILAKAAERNVTTLVFMIVPFDFEGTELSRKAAETEQGIGRLGDIRILCRNDDLCMASPGTTLEESFSAATKTLAEGITLLWRMTAIPGYINIDSATLVNIIHSGRGPCNLGVGIAGGPQRVMHAMETLLGNRGTGIGTRLTGAKAALVGIIGGEDLRLQEIAETLSSIGSALSMDAHIRMGTVLDRTMTDSIRVVVLLFREWNPLYGSETDSDSAESQEDATSAPPRKSGTRYNAPDAAGKTPRNRVARKVYNDRFQNSAATCRNGENLDKPTYLRHKLHLDLS